MSYGVIRRFVVFCALTFWLGGFVFYEGVVVRIAHRVAGHRFGFVTQIVTNWLNLAGFVVLVLLVWNWAVTWARLDKSLRRFVVCSFVVMSLALLALVALHARMDSLLDFDTREATDQAQFNSLHRMYMIVSTVHWLGAMGHVWCLTTAWQESGK